MPQAFHGHPLFHLLSQAKKFKLLGIPFKKLILFCPWLWILPMSMENITSMPNHLRLKVQCLYMTTYKGSWLLVQIPFYVL